MKAFYHFGLVLLAISNLAKADFRDEALALQNKFRKKHHVPDFIRNSTLDKIAQESAEAFVKDPSTPTPGRNGNYGENRCYLHSIKTDSEIVKIAIDTWYSGVKDYDYNKPEVVKGTWTKHFAQLVWKKSKYIGIGVARSSSATYVCVDYDPPGNYRESYAENILKP